MGWPATLIRFVMVAVLSATALACQPATTETAPTTTASAAATAIASGGAARCVDSQIHPAGAFTIDADATLLGFPAALTLTDGWHGCSLLYKDLGDPGGEMLIGTWDVTNVYADPCHWKTSLPSPAVGPAVDDLVAALASQAITESTTPDDVVLDGYAGKRLRLSVALSFHATDCDADQIQEFRIFNGPGDAVWWLGAADAAGLIGDVWVVQVGGQRSVIQAASFTDAGEEHRAELQRIVESIDFMP